MKTSKLLNKFILILLLYSFPTKTLLSNEPVDIWEIKKKENSTEENIVEKENNNKEITQGILIEKQNEKIIVNNSLVTNNIKLAGLYDPEENGLSIDMWSNSDGNEIKNTLENITSLSTRHSLTIASL